MNTAVAGGVVLGSTISLFLVPQVREEFDRHRATIRHLSGVYQASNHMVAPTLSANYHHSMKLDWSDWNRACISAAVLLALAGLAVFKIPHGFEEGVGWYLCLLPGAIFAAAISDLIQKVIPQSKSIVFDTLLIGFNFLWYFVISYLPLKTYRSISATLRKF